VSLKLAFICKCFIACLTLESNFDWILIISFLIIVALQMHFQSAGPHERLHAYQALIRPNIRMLPFVVCQMTLSRKRSAAFFMLTSKWLFACVDTDMRFKITVLSEAFIAHLTFEGLLASVCS
jgi:hypothetical protein